MDAVFEWSPSALVLASVYEERTGVPAETILANTGGDPGAIAEALAAYVPELALPFAPWTRGAMMEG